MESMRGEGPWNQSFGVDICLMPDESMPAPPPGGPRKGQKRSREQQTPVAYWSNTQGWVKWPQAGDKVEFPRTSNREYTIAEDGPSNYILTADAKQVASWNTDYPYGWDPVEGLIGNFRRMSIRDANWIEKFTETRGLELHKSSNAISLELKSYVECRSTNMSNPVNTEDSISAAQMAKYARHHVQYAFLLNEYDRSDDTDRTPTAAESLPDYKALTEWEKAPASFIFRKAAMPPQYKRYQITWTCSAASARPLPLLDDVVPIISVHSDEVGAKVFQSSQTVKDALLGAIMQHVSTQNRNNKFTSEMYTIRRVGGGPYQAHIEVTLTLPPGAEAEAWWKGRTSVDEPVNQTYLRSYSAPGDMEKLCDFGIAEFANGLLNNSPINPVIFLTWGESNNTWGSTPPKSYGILAPLALETAKLVRAYDTTIVNLMQDLCGIIDKSNVTFEALGNYISAKTPREHSWGLRRNDCGNLWRSAVHGFSSRKRRAYSTTGGRCDAHGVCKCWRIRPD